MITDEELKIILEQHGYAQATGACWPGCYEFHAHCAIRWLVATVRELAPYAAKRIETKGIAEETREKELVKFMEHFLDMMRITDSFACNAYLEAARIIDDIKGVPRDEDLNPHLKKKPKPKKPAPDTSFDYEQLD
ncbi:MAG: hypothetical protein K2Q15_15825 [Burkholderiales bacterium]|nr:hypothetical protein [Burkholderiales bacterium]